MLSSIGNKIVFSKNLRRLLSEHDISRTQICKDLNIAYTTFNDWYNGVKYPRIDKIELIANYFNVMKSELIEEHENIADNIIRPGFLQRPLVGEIACGEPILAEHNIIDYVDVPEHIHCDFALKCHGDSMINANIHDGDIVYIRKQPEVQNGQIAAVLVEGEEAEATLKRVYFREGRLTLKPENSKYEPRTYINEELEHVRILGLAVGFTHIIEN